jgi:hypothetical protein
MILAPNFSEFIALYILTFIHNKLFDVHCIYLPIMCLALGNSTPELLFEDFQEHVFEGSEVFFSGQQGKCP